MGPVATAYSIAPEQWPEVRECLSEQLVFTRPPSGSAIPVGGTLLSVKHVNMKCLADLRMVKVSSKRIWMRVTNPQSEKRRLSSMSRALLAYWHSWASYEPQMMPLRAPARW